MAQERSTPPSDQVSTSDIDASHPEETRPTRAEPRDVDAANSPPPKPNTTEDIAPATEGPETSASAGLPLHPGVDTKGGVGVDGEEVVWEARYSMKNFLGRVTGAIVLLIGWIGLAIYSWSITDDSRSGLGLLTVIAGIVGLCLLLALIYQILLARYSHYYRLTTRRLFVSSGLFDRRRDMTELLKVEDVYTRQTLIQRWLSLGTVMVVSSDQKFPMVYLLGVDNPKEVMDTVWHYARAERDHKSVRVDSL